MRIEKKERERRGEQGGSLLVGIKMVAGKTI